MSGICGLFNLDANSVTDPELRAMTAMLEKRGPERTGIWQDGSIGLGQTLLATTPELVFERQPFTHKVSGCVITADVRLDNRDELLDSLGLLARRESIGDAELILRAYLDWGEASLDNLLGDFAFAIWDPRHQKLFGARDHFGMRPFYYHHAPGRRFVFASDARAILVLPQVPYCIDQGRIADFLVPQLEWIDYTSTFYEGVFRLPPGHKVTVTNKGLHIAEYWRPQPGPELGPMTDDDYAEGFLELFTQAVDSRLRTPTGAVGSMLSGGVDSGSVVAVGKDILAARGDEPLPTFSAVRHRNIDCAESGAIYAASEMPSISPQLIHPDTVQDGFESLIVDIEEPFDGQFTFLKSIYQAARTNGQIVILDGGGGDVILAEGSHIVRLLRRGQVRLALAEIAGECRFWGYPSVSRSVLRYARSALVPEPVKRQLRKLLQLHGSGIEAYLEDSLISRDFASDVNLEARRERMRLMFPGGWTPDYAVERSNAILPNMTGGRERYARVAAGAATEARDPFLDKRLVDYCSRLPGRLRLKHGWPKMMLRELMTGRLPDQVRWAREKPHIGWLFNTAVSHAAWKRGILDLPGLQSDLLGYVDSAALAKAWQSFRAGHDAGPIHTAYVLSIWLHETEKRPVVPS